MNHYKKYKVRFWNHESLPHKPLNDCFGNSCVREVSARNFKEAEEKESKCHPRFRLHSVEEMK